jgi:RNA polymerase sigma-70 factor (ECF subfamily)
MDAAPSLTATALSDDSAASALLAATPRLLAIAGAILGSPSDAEEAVQEVLLSAWRAWDSLREPAARTAWLTRVCVRRCVRHRDALRLRRRHEAPMPEALRSPDAETVDAAWDGAFARLSRRQRAVVSLHYYHGYTLDECAALLGCGPGSARQHLARALRRLRETIDDV